MKLNKISAKQGIDPFIKFRNLSLRDWHDTVAYSGDLNATGFGEQGKPVILPKDNTTLNKIRVNEF